MDQFNHIPDSEKQREWFLLLKPVLSARIKRGDFLESRLIFTLNKTEGTYTWITLRDTIESIIKIVKNGKDIFSRGPEVENDPNPDNPIEDMFAEFRAVPYLIQKGFSNLEYFRQDGSDFHAQFEEQTYYIEVTYIHGPDLKTFHNNPDLAYTLFDRQDPDYHDKVKKCIENWEYSRKLTNLLRSRYSKKESQIKKRKIPLQNCLILIITDLFETYEPVFDHSEIDGEHPILHFVKRQEIATVVHGSGSVYEPMIPTALGGNFTKLSPFAWENYSKQKF